MSNQKETIDTLGTILDAPMGRDAVHVAVISGRCSTGLKRGASAIWEYGVIVPSENHAGAIGIVDPMLDRDPEEGEIVWLWLYPRSTTSLRHVWTHPAVPPESVLSMDLEEAQRIIEEEWKENWGWYQGKGDEECDYSLKTYIEQLTRYATEPYGAMWQHDNDINPKIWDALRVLTGCTVRADVLESPAWVSCTC